MSVDSNSNERFGKPGRPSGLRQFEDGSAPPILAPLAVPELNGPDWLGCLSGYIVRKSYDENSLLDRLECSLAFETFVFSQLRKFNQQPISKHLAHIPGIEVAVPRIWAYGLKRERSIEIGRGLFRVAKRTPVRLHYVASGFPYASTKRMRIGLNEPADAKFGRNLIALIRDISIDWLVWRIVGFRIGDQQSDISAWLKLLRLPGDTPIHWVRPCNPRTNYSMDIAIEIIDIRTGRISGEFHTALLWAAAIELWRIPRREIVKRREYWCPASDQLFLFDFELTASGESAAPGA